MPTRIPCVGAVIISPLGQVLLVRRGHEPSMGLWSLPGGRVEPGESDEQAVTREVREETGLTVACGSLLGRVTLPGPDGGVFDVADYRADVTGGELGAGDDADDARWVAPAALAGLELTPRLAELLAAWGAVPGPGSPPGRPASRHPGIPASRHEELDVT